MNANATQSINMNNIWRISDPPSFWLSEDRTYKSKVQTFKNLLIFISHYSCRIPPRTHARTHTSWNFIMCFALCLNNFVAVKSYMHAYNTHPTLGHCFFLVLHKFLNEFFLHIVFFFCSSSPYHSMSVYMWMMHVCVCVCVSVYIFLFGYLSLHFCGSLVTACE